MKRSVPTLDILRTRLALTIAGCGQDLVDGIFARFKVRDIAALPESAYRKFSDALLDARQLFGGPDDDGFVPPTEDEARESRLRWPAVSAEDAQIVLDHALRYAAQGWKVFPLSLRAGELKKPVVKWGRGATSDPNEVRRLWAKFPGAGIGVATKASKLVCADLDNKNDKDGSSLFSQLMGGDYGTQLVATTPSGGEHYIYRADPDVEFRSRNNSLGDGIDIKAGGGTYGGYFVAPNGIDKRSWVNDGPDRVEPGSLPTRLRELLVARDAMDRKPRSRPASSTPPSTSVAARDDDLESVKPNDWNELMKGVAEGSRNSTAARLAGFHLAQGRTVAQVLELLRPWAARCSPPFPESELAEVVDSIARTHERRRTERAEAVFSTIPQRAHSDTAATPDKAVRRSVSLGDEIARWAIEGPLVHQTTGIELLDRMTGGGPTFGTRVILLGPPDACKTLFLVQMLDICAGLGVTCGILAIDEEASDIATRFLQRRGWPRARIEKRDPSDIPQMQQAVGALPVRVYGPEWTIEQAAEDLAAIARANSTRAFLGVDSIQIARCDAELDAPTRYEVVTARMMALRHVATKHGMLVVATSEMSRAAYRNEDNRISDMAAGKDSGAVEYQTRLLLSLRSVQNEPDLVELRVAKNKFGRRHRDDEPGIYLRFDRDAQTLVVDTNYQPASRDKSDAVKNAQQILRGVQDAARVAVVLARFPGIGARECEAKTKANGTMSRDRFAVARSVLDGALVELPGTATSKHLHLHGGLVPKAVLEAIPEAERLGVVEARPPSTQLPDPPVDARTRPDLPAGGSDDTTERDARTPPLGGAGGSRVSCANETPDPRPKAAGGSTPARKRRSPKDKKPGAIGPLGDGGDS